MTGLKLVLAAATLSIATNALAATTDASRYHKIWDKNVTTDLQKPKIGCMCLPSGRLGTLVRPGTDDVALCALPVFDSGGSSRECRLPAPTIPRAPK